MTQRMIIPYPNKVLTTPAAPVDAITDDIRAIWDEMIDVMDAMPGYGLAAPQLGVGLAEQHHAERHGDQHGERQPGQRLADRDRQPDHGMTRSL